MKIKKKFELSKEKEFFQVICKKEVTEITNDQGEITALEIEGYASTKDKDRVNDIVLPEAFEESMKTYATNPIVLLQHDKNKPIGTVTDYRIDNQGLFIKARITEDVDGVFSAVKNNVLRTFSIGYRVQEFKEEPVTARDENGNDMIV
jgi:HK97 family phage prohead protease